MPESDLRHELGARIKGLRKQKGWSQKQLADKVGIRYQQLNKYEGGFNVPSLDKLVALSEALLSTVDYLLTGNHSDGLPLHNSRLLERFKALQEIKGEEQEVVLQLIDAVLVKNRVEGVLKSVG